MSAIDWIAKQLGHTNIQVTLKFYARFIPDANENYGEKAVDRFGPRSNSGD